MIAAVAIVVVAAAAVVVVAVVFALLNFHSICRVEMHFCSAKFLALYSVPPLVIPQLLLLCSLCRVHCGERERELAKCTDHTIFGRRISQRCVVSAFLC